MLPAVGNGLVHFQKQGQLPRLLAHLEAYGGLATYFSYMDDRGLWPDRLGRLVAPQRPVRSQLRYALTRPLRERGAFRECDVLRCTSLLGAIPAIVAKAMYWIPFVFSHGADYIRIAQIHGRSRLHVQKWRALRAVAMRMAAAVIVQNEAMGAKLRAEYPMARIVHIPNWVDTDHFKPAYALKDVKTVLYVGRLVEEKNLRTLALACATVGATLTCLGEGPLRETLEGFCAISRSVKVRLPGAVPWGALPRWYPEHAVFAMVSKTEGHCKALAEAMAAGMTCLVSKAVTEGMRAGHNCLSVDPDETSIALGLEVLFTDRDFAVRLGTEARKTAVQLWSKQTVLDQEIRLLRSVTR